MKTSSEKKYKYLFSWSFYDFANSAYVLIIGSFFFPLFFKEVVFSGESIGDFYWGLAISVSVLIAILLGPFIGYYSDISSRKVTFSFIILLVFLSSLGLAIIDYNERFVYITTFILTNSLFTISLLIYDSYLPHISNKENRSLYSAFGWGFGYLGGILCFIAVYLIQRNFGEYSKYALLVTSLFFLVFSIPSIYNLPITLRVKKYNIKNVFLKYFNKKLISTLAAFWIINDVIAVLIYFTAIYAKDTLELSILTIGIILLGVQFFAFPFTWLSGIISKKYSHILGDRQIIIWSLFIWVIIIIGLIFSTELWHIIVVSFLTSTVIGTTQASLRSYYSRLLPKDVSGFSFGIYGIVAKTSALVGPLLFGLISSIWGNQRIALIFVLVLLIIGGIIFKFQKINTERSS